MSASPANAPSGPNSATPSGNPHPPVMRKKPPVNIFAPKKKPIRKPAASQPPTAQRPTPNGVAGAQPQHHANGVPTAQEESRDYQEFPIYVSKTTLEQGLHYHAMRLKSTEDKVVNPYDPTQFQRPVRLHRRMARDKRETAEQSDAASGVDDKERELLSIKRAERQAEREANQALIAPTGGEAKKSAKKKPQKKVEDVYYDENNPKHKQRAQLRYEEARPWHLEDFEGKNVWVGSYEEPLSARSVVFEINGAGFRMVPLEKWYTFTQTNRFNVMDSDAVEKHMGQKVKAPRWFLGTQLANDEARRQATFQARTLQRMKARESEDDYMPVKREEYHADVDEIDFEFNDEFQDDDEGMIFGDQDDEAKETEKKLRDEMREANLAGTGLKDDEKDWDKEEQEEKRKEQEEKRKSKRMRKQLIKKERKNEYDSDSDRGEFSESEESEDSEEERERVEEERKQEEARKANGDKSGASSKGTNTPTGRLEKRDPNRLATTLKRPGSPDLSEMSGNESSRKRAKGVNGRAVSSAPNGARSLSPDIPTRPARSGYNSASETDTSRPGRPKIRLKNSPPGSPHERSPQGSRTASRAASPSLTTAAAGGADGVRSRTESEQRKPFPTIDEVRASVPAEGIDLKELVRMFRPRVPAARQPDFIALVKQVGKQDPVSKKIVPKEGGATAASAA